MALIHADTEQAYQAIRQRIISLELPPGAPVSERHLAQELGLDPVPVQEALQFLAHEGLVVITPRQEHGIYVASIHLADLDQLSETRLALETLCARLAAQRATPDDLLTMEALRRQLAAIPAEDTPRLFEVDYGFHQAIAQAARNSYLADMLDRLFGLAQRLWHLAPPHLDFLSAAVEQHVDLLEAIRTRDAERAARLMHHHVADFYDKVRRLLTARVTVQYGSDVRDVVVEENAMLGGAIIATGLPLEQPCAGRGTCGKCKVLVEGSLDPPDEVEEGRLSEAERLAGYRLACRARVREDVTVTLAPIVVYSNKIFRTSEDYRKEDVPLGLAIDLGSTTVAAFLTTLPDGKVCAGAAALNQQTVFGADVISRMAEASAGQDWAERLSALARASILQAVDALKLARSVKARVRKITIVGNCAMHHLLRRCPVDTLITLPFQPHSTATVRGVEELFAAILPPQAEVALPPLIGGFVGSDALACLTYYGFDRASGPLAAIDLGTNGEVMVTDGHRILVASTAAGPAFEGVNISCGTRAVDGAIVGVQADPGEGHLSLTTIAEHPTFGPLLDHDDQGVRRFLITAEGADRRGFDLDEEGARVPLYLTQNDIRELQKAKAAIRAAAETLLAKLDLNSGDLQRVILTGSFGSQLNVEAVLELGMIPPVAREVVETSANGAGLGAALFLDDEEFARGERIAAQAEQVDLDLDPGFNTRFIDALNLTGRTSA